MGKGMSDLPELLAGRSVRMCVSMETKVGSGAGEAAITPLCSGWESQGGHDLPETHTEDRDPANPPEGSRPPDA